MNPPDPFALGGKCADEDDEENIAAITFEAGKPLSEDAIERLLYRTGIYTRVTMRLFAKSKAELIEVAHRDIANEEIALLELSDAYIIDLKAMLGIAEIVQARLAVAYTAAALESGDLVEVPAEGDA